MQKIHVESCVQAFAGDALLRGMPLEQRQGQLTQQGKVLGTVAGLDATAGLPKRYIPLPGRFVLNPPMRPQRLSLATGARHRAADKITKLIAGFAAKGSLRVTHAERRQSRPCFGVTNARSVVLDRITAIRFAAVATLPCLIGVVFQTNKIPVTGIDKGRLDVVVEMFLIFLDRQDVVAAALDDLLSNGLGTAHRINRHQDAMQVQQL